MGSVFQESLWVENILIASLFTFTVVPSWPDPKNNFVGRTDDLPNLIFT